jgi:hypothetical protein
MVLSSIVSTPPFDALLSKIQLIEPLWVLVLPLVGLFFGLIGKSWLCRFELFEFMRIASHFPDLEQKLANRNVQACFAKLIRKKAPRRIPFVDMDTFGELWTAQCVVESYLEVLLQGHEPTMHSKRLERNSRRLQRWRRAVAVLLVLTAISIPVAFVAGVVVIIDGGKSPAFFFLSTIVYFLTLLLFWLRNALLFHEYVPACCDLFTSVADLSQAK